MILLKKKRKLKSLNFVKAPISNEEKVTYYKKVHDNFNELNVISDKLEANRQEINKNNFLKLIFGVITTILLTMVLGGIITGFFSEMGKDLYSNTFKDTTTTKQPDHSNY